MHSHLAAAVRPCVYVASIALFPPIFVNYYCGAALFESFSM